MVSFRARRTLFLVLLGVVVTALTRSLWLGALGGYLIRADAPARADYAVVLAGDAYGNRIIKGAELVRQGLVRKALVSGPDGCYGVNEAELAVNFAVRRGYPVDYFIQVRHHSTNTWDEAKAIIPELRRLGAGSFLLVTSDYHTRRAGHCFRQQLAGGLEMRVIAAPDKNFQWNSWWRSREGQKVFYMEWSKTVASVFGL